MWIWVIFIWFWFIEELFFGVCILDLCLIVKLGIVWGFWGLYCIFIVVMFRFLKLIVGRIFSWLYDFFFCSIFGICCRLYIKFILFSFIGLIFIKYGIFVVLCVCCFVYFLFMKICFGVFGWISFLLCGFLLWWNFLVLLFNFWFVFIFFLLLGIVYGREILWLFSWFFSWVWKFFSLFVIFVEVGLIFNCVMVIEVLFWYL